jgi:parallel beta-helix repeat protein
MRSISGIDAKEERMQSKIRSITLLVTGIFAVGSLWAADFYVAPDGNDNNPGTLEKPFKDPGRAVKELMPGDTLHFRAGTYSPKVSNHISLAPVCSGEKGKPITLRNYENEHVKIVVPGLEFGLSDNGYSWIVFDGFEVVAGVRGFRFGRGMNGKYGHHITVRNCEVHSASREQGLFAQGVPFLTIENNVFRNQKRSHGMYLAAGCHNAVIRNNTCMHNRGNSAMQLRGGVTNMLVENNLFFGNAQGISLSATVKNSVIRNNVIHSNGYKGPRDSGWREIIFDPGMDILVENNTIVNLIPNNHALMNIFRVRPRSKNLTFRNNIVVCRGKPLFTLEAHEGFVFENNLLYNVGGGGQVKDKGDLVAFAKANNLTESGTIVADPLFEDLRASDFRLTKDSPAVDAGAQTEGTVKVVGKARDIGAYELGGDVVIGARLPWKVAKAE